MKKKYLGLLLIPALFLGACEFELPFELPFDIPFINNGKKDAEIQKNLDDAASYLFQVYKSTSVTIEDYYLPASYKDYTVTWTITKGEGGYDDAVVIAPNPETEGEHAGYYLVTVTYFRPETTNYTLVATVTNGKLSSSSNAIERKVSGLNVDDFSSYITKCKNGEDVTVKGYIVGVVSKSSSSGGSMYILDETGHGYYVYNPNLDTAVKESDEILRSTYPIGCEIIATGTGTVYGGCYELSKGCSVIKTGKSVTFDQLCVRDASSVFEAATGHDDESLIDYQCSLVNLKDCVLGDIVGSYYYFKVGAGTVKYNVYDSYYFLNEEDRQTIKDAFVTDYLGDIFGIVTVYSSIYQIYPVDTNAVTNVHEQQLTDAEKVAKVKDELALSKTEFKQAGQVAITTSAFGGAVTVSYAADSELVTFDDANMYVTPGADDVLVTVTATITCNETSDSVEFTLTIAGEGSEKLVYVDEAEEGKSYKIGMYQANTDETLYLTGEMNGFYPGSTTNIDDGANVEFVAVEGGVNIKVTKGDTVKYLNGAASGKYTNLTLDDEPSSVWVYDEELKLYTVEVNGHGEGYEDRDGFYYFGTYAQNKNFSLSQTTKITGENASTLGVSNFVAKPCYWSLPEKLVWFDDANSSKLYKIGMYQVNTDQMLYLSGEMNGFYPGSTTNPDDGANVQFVEVEGGVNIKVIKGETVKYLNGAASGKYTNLTLDDEPSSVWVYDEELKLYTVEVNGHGEGYEDRDGFYYFGTYAQNVNFSLTQTTKITGENASTLGVSNFVAKPCYWQISEKVTWHDEAEEGKQYVIAMYQAKNDTNLYLTGAMSGTYAASTQDGSKAAKVEFIAVEGGYNIKVIKGDTVKYMNAVASGKYSNISFDDEPASVWVYNEEAKVYTVEVTGHGEGYEDKDGFYYFGTYGTNSNFGLSLISYITGENINTIGASNFIGRPAEFRAEQITHMGDNAVVDDDTKYTGPVTLNRNTLFAGLTGTSYASYDNEYKVNVYTVTTTDVLGNSNNNYDVLQMKKGSGNIKIDGTFKKVTVVLESTNDYKAEKGIELYYGTTKVTIDATAINDARTDGGKNKDQANVYLYTFVVELNEAMTGTFEIKNVSTNATYVTSIVVEQ